MQGRKGLAIVKLCETFDDAADPVNSPRKSEVVPDCGIIRHLLTDRIEAFEIIEDRHIGGAIGFDRPADILLPGKKFIHPGAVRQD